MQLTFLTREAGFCVVPNAWEESHATHLLYLLSDAGINAVESLCHDLPIRERPQFHKKVLAPQSGKM